MLRFFGMCPGSPERDVMEGTQMILVLSDRPPVVYTGDAKLVGQKVEQLALEGDGSGLQMREKVCGRVVRQKGMTNVYGVATAGPRQQTIDRFAETDVLPKYELFVASFKLARTTLSSLCDIYTSHRNYELTLKFCSLNIY